MKVVETILLENIEKADSLFIFPTDISLSRWADHLLRLRGGTIAMNKFIAWDKFKQKSVKSKVKDKKSIPSALRKIFICRLISENADAIAHNREPIFTSLIRVQWAQHAQQFSSWVTLILPQLGTWFYKAAGLPADKILTPEAKKAALNFKGDDKDMYNLACHYAQFLEKHSLFEPAWETPPFNNAGKKCFIFFPESLSDYSEYKQLLSESAHVKVISVKNTDEKPANTFFYKNSRREITEAALYIRALHEKQNIPWDSIAVCIGDSQNYEPYVLRELSVRNIPFVKRTGKPLSDYPAGCFFRSILDCVSESFSFSSLVSLIMNKNLPWKNTDTIDGLIQFGISNNCLYSWIEENNEKKQHINVWEDAFNNPVEYTDKEIYKFFNELKKRIASFRFADSFTELRRQYFIFRKLFFDMDSCTDETNLVLSRCISELMDLVELEKNFPSVPADDPFLFFTEYLSDVNYLAQPKSSGVAILPYKTAAAAPFDCHIILGAGQESISVVYPRLSFLPGLKRKELGITDEDASKAFINMHKFNSVKGAAFFCSEHTFSDFSIPHPEIKAPKKPEDFYAADLNYSKLFSRDYYSEENQFFSVISSGNTAEDVILHENQAEGFSKWKTRRNKTPSHKIKLIAHNEVKKLINSIFVKNSKPSISSTTLQSYNQCSLVWLFSRVYNLKNTQIETSLMDNSVSGSVYHAILFNFFSKIKKSDEPLMEPVNSGFGITLPVMYLEILNKSIDNVFNNFPVLDSDKKSRMSSLTARLLLSAKNEYHYNCEHFITAFLSHFAGCTVAGCEKNYQSVKDSYVLNGFIDIILKDKSDKFIIVDYKIKYLPYRPDCTGEAEDGLSDFQLPVYITLAEDNEKHNVNTALFYSILDAVPEVIIGSIYDINTGKTTPFRKDDKIDRDSEQYNFIFDSFTEKTKKYAYEIENGIFTVFPSDCTDCSYHRICRTAYFINRETGLFLQEN
ncbi:MAG: PD-(D/E)XK nuclease family protein [Treponema sp.]|nr:PD-(D/E)XK nuclease family protein [Treponema sp.]